MILAGDDPVAAYRFVRHRHKVDAVEIRSATARETIWLLVTGDIVIISHESQIPVHLMLFEPEWASPDELVLRNLLVAGCLRHRRRGNHRLRARQEARQHTGGLVECHPDRAVVRGIDAVEPPEDQLAAAIYRAPPVERRHDISGCQWVAIVKTHARTQLEGELRAIGVDVVVIDQHRLRREGGVVGEQSLEDLLGHVVRHGRRCEYRIGHRGRLADDGHLDCPALGGFRLVLRRSYSRQAAQRECPGGTSRPEGELPPGARHSVNRLRKAFVHG